MIGSAGSSTRVSKGSFSTSVSYKKDSSCSGINSVTTFGSGFGSLTTSGSGSDLSITSVLTRIGGSESISVFVAMPSIIFRMPYRVSKYEVSLAR